MTGSNNMDLNRNQSYSQMTKYWARDNNSNIRGTNNNSANNSFNSDISSNSSSSSRRSNAPSTPLLKSPVLRPQTAMRRSHSLTDIGEKDIQSSQEIDPQSPQCFPHISIRVSIPKWSLMHDSNRKYFVMYHVIMFTDGRPAWEVKKTYNDFAGLHRSLQLQSRIQVVEQRRSNKLSSLALHQLTDLPTFPSNRQLFGTETMDVKDLAERCSQLELYVRSLLECGCFERFAVLREYLTATAPAHNDTLTTVCTTFRDTSKIQTPILPPSPVTLSPLNLPPALTIDSNELNQTKVQLTYPKWVNLDSCWNQTYPTDEDKMNLAIELSNRNVSEGTGGPFAAVIFDSKQHTVLALGVSLVTMHHNCTLHAEMVAIQMAQARCRDYSLKSFPCELFSTSDPCAMCIGGILWSGIQRLVCAATDVDVRFLLCDPGPVFEQSFSYLKGKGIEIKRRFLREEAKKVISDYVMNGWDHPGRQV